MPISVPNFDHSGLALRTRHRSLPIGGCAPGRVVIGKRVVAAAAAERGGGGFRRQHAGQHGVVAALDARHVHEAGVAADQRAAGKCKLRHRLEAAFGQGARAISEPLAAGERVAHQLWVLKRWNSSNGDRYGLE